MTPCTQPTDPSEPCIDPSCWQSIAVPVVPSSPSPRVASAPLAVMLLYCSVAQFNRACCTAVYFRGKSVVGARPCVNVLTTRGQKMQPPAWEGENRGRNDRMHLRPEAGFRCRSPAAALHASEGHAGQEGERAGCGRMAVCGRGMGRVGCRGLCHTSHAGAAAQRHAMQGVCGGERWKQQ